MSGTVVDQLLFLVDYKKIHARLDEDLNRIKPYERESMRVMDTRL